MAAYAALVSVMHIIEQIQDHPRPPFYLDNKHAQRLIEKVTFLQDFLEVYSHVRNEVVERLESRIAEAAYAAEDLIETHIVDQIHAQSARHGRRICSSDFYQDLQKVIEDMDSIKNELMEVQTRIGQVGDIQQHTGSPMFPAGPSGSFSMDQNIMVGFDDVSLELKSKLIQKQSNRQVIAIVGMGGIGKTTLAKIVYGNQLIVEYFDICAWATISQGYSARKILVELLLCQKNQASWESLSEQDLRDRLHKSLFSRRYLIRLDDMWSIEAWDKIKSLFPENNNGSRVIVTTRQSNIASDLTRGRYGSIIEMNFLNDDISWELLSKVAFGSKDRCPLQLEETGKKIAKSCKGLPLAIVVIGGLLAKSQKTPEYWEYIAKNLHSLEENEHCLNLLCMSYNHLPVNLKPCFLYMGIPDEDSDIYVPGLMRLWVVEGFLRPIRGKSLEEVAIDYFEDLVNRNLILVEKRYYNGEAEVCKIHDLLRDLCLRESQKDKFLVVIRQDVLSNSLQGINIQRRISIQVRRPEEGNQQNFLQICDALHSASLARTLIWNIVDHVNIWEEKRTKWKLSPSPNNRLLRVFSVFGSSYGDCHSMNSISQLVNLRCIMISVNSEPLDLPSLTNLFWNLQTIVIDETKLVAFEIWKMPLLRCLLVEKLHLTNPRKDDFVLENLHTLGSVYGFRCSEKVVKRIPNIKALEIFYEERFIISHYYLDNLTRLHKLKQLACMFYGQMPSRTELLQILTFPDSLQELMLEGCYLHWEDILTMIGSLPLLQVLKLEDKSFIGPEWETIEEQFCSLKILKITDCDYLRWWKTESSHFPCLEELDLNCVHGLEEIPSSIGDISTMRLIQLGDCSESANNSALKIAEEQEELENHDLHVRISKYPRNLKITGWARPYSVDWTLMR